MSGRPFRPLRRRAVVLVWSAGLFSDIGTWVQLIVVGSLVARTTGSALYTGLTALALFTPQGVCAPIGGLLADRFDRRKVFVAALCGQAAATAVLATALGAGVRDPLVLSAIIVFSSGAGAIGQPAYAAMLPDLVPPEELVAMVSLGIYSWNAGRIVGPLLGTVLVDVIGPAWTVGFNAFTFAAMALAIAALRRRSFAPPGTDAEGIAARLREGWHALQQVPGCRYGIAMIMILNLAVGPFMGLIPIFARQVFDGGTGLAGAFSALQGAGAIVGGLLLASLAMTFGRSRLIVTAVVMLVGAYLVYALAPTPFVAGAAIICLGAGSASMFTNAMALVQRDAPNGERGRVLSISQCAMGFCYGFGVLWISVLGDLTNLRAAFVTAAGVALVASAVGASRAPGWQRVVDGDVDVDLAAVRAPSVGPSTSNA